MPINSQIKWILCGKEQNKIQIPDLSWQSPGSAHFTNIIPSFLFALVIDLPVPKYVAYSPLEPLT